MWMRMAVLAAAVTLARSSPPPLTLKEDTWVLVISGSNTYLNYRHQADASHGYHVFINQGVPPSRIVTMMFDDIAYHKENPQPGVLINRPNGTNVYKGVKIDYKGWDVNSTNFLNVLTGNKAAMKGIGTGRVIESNANSTVFVYFTGHGGPGVLFFPSFATLPADDLHKALKEMHRKKRYDKMIMYIDACYVGSVFEGIIEENTGVFIMSGSARDEGSWVWYCGNRNYTTCKGDEFSVMLLEYLDSVEPGVYKSLNEIFQRVRKNVAKSHITLYGDLSVGQYSFRPNVLGKNPIKEGRRSLAAVGAEEKRIKASDATVFYLQQKSALSRNLRTRLEARASLEKLYIDRKIFDKVMDNLVNTATADNPQERETINNDHLALRTDIFPCYKRLLSNFWKYCSLYERTYTVNQLYKLANICVLQIDTTRLTQEMPRICSSYQANNISSNG